MLRWQSPGFASPRRGAVMGGAADYLSNGRLWHIMLLVRTADTAFELTACKSGYMV